MSVCKITNDVIVIGAGAAGLTVALNLLGTQVSVLTKTKLGEGASTCWAQGGIAVAVGENDSPDLHAQDTLAVSGELADPLLVDILTQQGLKHLQRLIELGAQFDRASSV